MMKALLAVGLMIGCSPSPSARQPTYPYRSYGPLRVVQLPFAVEARIAEIDTVQGTPKKGGGCDWKPFRQKAGLRPILGEWHTETCEARVFFIGANPVAPPPVSTAPPKPNRPWLNPKVKVNSKRDMTLPRLANGKCDFVYATNRLGGPPPPGTMTIIGDIDQATCTTSIYNLTFPRPLFGNTPWLSDTVVKRAP